MTSKAVRVTVTHNTSTHERYWTGHPADAPGADQKRCLVQIKKVGGKWAWWTSLTARGKTISGFSSKKNVARERAFNAVLKACPPYHP